MQFLVLIFLFFITGNEQLKRITEPTIAYPIMNTFDKHSFLFFIVFDGEVGDDFAFSLRIGYLTYKGNITHLDHDVSLDYASKSTWPMPLPQGLC